MMGTGAFALENLNKIPKIFRKKKSWVTCRVCNGMGKIIGRECPNCNGRGVVQE